MKHSSKSLIYHLIGVILFMLSILVMTALISKFMVTHQVSTAVEEWMLNVVIFIASFIGNLISANASKDKDLAAALLYTGAVLLLLITASACIDGQFENITIRIASVIAGVAASALIHRLKPRKRNYRKRHSR